MSKRALKRIVMVICFMISVIFVGKISAFADEIHALNKLDWTTLASMSIGRRDFQTKVIDGKIYAIGGIFNTDEISSAEVYDPTTNTWTTLASMSIPRKNFQTEVIDGKIYVIGGYNSKQNNGLSSVEVYNPTTNKWTTLTSMSDARFGFQTEVIDGKIYAIGGYSGSEYPKSIEVYNPAANTWTKLASMSTGRKDLQTEVIDGKIYAIGGHYYTVGLSSTEVYDPTTNTWTTLASMTETRKEFQTGIVDGKIYAIGGSDESSSLTSTEVYNPTTNTWTKLASMSAARRYFQIEVINGKIYAIGGIRVTPISLTEVYDPTTNTWTTLASMSEARCMFQTEVLNGKIYSIGGYGGSKYLNTTEVYDTDTELSSNLKAIGGDAKIDLVWNAVTNATSYTIKRSTTAGGPYTTIASGITGTTYTDTGVTNGTAYYYVVTAIVNGTEGWNSNEASATPQASTEPNQPTGNKALLVITMVTGERKEYEMTTDKINDFITWYNSKATSNPTYMIEKEYNKASFTARKDYIAYDQISNFEVNEYND